MLNNQIHVSELYFLGIKNIVFLRFKSFSLKLIEIRSAILYNSIFYCSFKIVTECPTTAKHHVALNTR